MIEKDVPEQSGQNDNNGDTTHVVMTPFERFMSWADNPTINKSRQTGKLAISFPKRSGEVSFTFGKNTGILNFFIREDGTVTIKNTNASINEIIHKDRLVSLTKNCGPMVDKINLWLTTKKGFAVIDRDDLQKFLLAGCLVTM